MITKNGVKYEVYTSQGKISFDSYAEAVEHLKMVRRLKTIRTSNQLKVA